MELPMTPLAVPRNMLVTSRSSRVPAAMASDRTFNGVADVTPSRAGNLVMAVPKEISRKHRPARAGLMKFLPRPPKQHLTTKMAKMEPRMG